MPVGRCRLAIRWEQKGGMLVSLGGNVLGCPLGIHFFVVGSDGGIGPDSV